MIELKNVCKSFEKHVLFENLNLTIESGEFVICSGESGCGKTTLLHMIGSIEACDKGAIYVNGKDITQKKNQQSYLREEVGFLFQNFALIDGKTVREHLEMVRKNIRSDYSLGDVLSYVGMEEKINEKVYKLSGGEQQRVALARLLLKKCSIILADEPTGSLDTRNADKVLFILQQMNQLGKTIIMVTHVEKYKKIGTRNIDLGSA